MKNNKIGFDPFVWWIGIVEDRQDPLMLGRCRVRIIGTHTDNKVELPTDALPWAHPILPLNDTAVYAPKESDMVVGFFMDSTDGQFPIMMGKVPGIPTMQAVPQKGFFDNRSPQELATAPVKPNETATRYPRVLNEPVTSRLARNESIENSIVQQKINNKLDQVEPDPYYAAVYPYNRVYESESGHALEFDDTKGAERVHIFHRAGSYVEFGPDGSRAERIQKDKFTVVVGDDSIYVQGDVKMIVDGDYDLNVTGDIRINGKTINLNQGTMGAARIGDTADTGDEGAGGHFDVNPSGTNVIETGSGTVFIGD